MLMARGAVKGMEARFGFGFGWGGTCNSETCPELERTRGARMATEAERTRVAALGSGSRPRQGAPSAPLGALPTSQPAPPRRRSWCAGRRGFPTRRVSGAPGSVGHLCHRLALALCLHPRSRGGVQACLYRKVPRNWSKDNPLAPLRPPRCGWWRVGGRAAPRVAGAGTSGNVQAGCPHSPPQPRAAKSRSSLAGATRGWLGSDEPIPGAPRPQRGCSP